MTLFAMILNRIFLHLLFFGFAISTLGAAKPNVLFIVIDDLRPELGAYDTEAMLTPNIDRLAKKGIRFNNAFCQYPVCNPSRSSFLTGLRPDELGILENKTPLREKWPNIVTLPQLFRQNGYFTAGLGKLFHAGLDNQGKWTFFRDDASFDYFYTARGKTPEIGKKGIGRKLGDGTVGWCHWLAAEGGDEAQQDGMIAAEAARVLEEHHDEPFF
ncbi:MAG: sulfatase-like hydrolase/transferase, partial [Verrucomicrobiae bacterium]|nr:sulfatase-like hydrolase/transferase [Verrucomicrobiae bacterium]